MGKIKIFGKEYHYKPHVDEISIERLKQRLLSHRSFANIFRKNLTDGFIKSMQEVVNPNIRHEENTIWNVQGISGCQPKNSKILMYDGTWKNIEDIKVGDKVISYDKDMQSKKEIVLRTTKWKCTENYDLYQTNRHQKKLYSCSFNHIIPFNRTKGFRNKDRSIKKRNFVQTIDEMPAKEFYKFSRNRLNHSIMGITCPSINNFKQKKNCEIEPYSLGVYISDGSFNHGKSRNGNFYAYCNITKMPSATTEYINKLYPFDRINNKSGTECKTFSWNMDNGFCKLLKKYRYNKIKSGDKFIPKQALLSDLNYRKKLLAGLIDGDGHFQNGQYVIVSKSPKLIEQIESLIWSVGGRVNQRKRRKGKIASYGFEDWYWEISFFIHENQDIPILVRKKTTKSYYHTANRMSVILKKNNDRHDVFGFTLSGETGYYITDNWMLTHNSGKSLFVISLAKLLTKERFSYRNVVFYDQQILDRVKDIPRDSFLIRDETVATFGVGSQRIMADLTAVSETARKYGVNLAFLSPSEKEISVAKWNLHTVDIDYENRITRVGLQDPFTKHFLGAVYVKVLPDDDEDWVNYNVAKDEFITSVREGKRIGGKEDYKSMAQNITKKIDLEIFTKKKERLAYIRTELPNLTNAEIDMVATFVEIILKHGTEALIDEKEEER